MIKNYLHIVNYKDLKIFKKQFTRIIIAGNFFLLITIHLSAQVQWAGSMQSEFNSYQQHHLQEKIYIHTDKNTYLPGEICWFKIYNVDAYFHQPIDLGKCAYVEILDKNNKAVLQAKIALNKGVGDGSLYLPATIVSGNYQLRAYTNWMKNYGADYFFEKKLTIINVQKAQPENIVAQQSAYDIAFFPEGGNLVNNIKSKVGFKFSNQYGKGVYGEAVLLNEKNDTITTFRPLKFGMGNFSFTPVAGIKYRAVVTLPGGQQQVKELPAVYSTGYAMQLEKNSNGQIKITVQTPDKDNLSPVPVSIFLFVHTRNIVKAAISNGIKNGQAEFLVDDTIPGDGISTFTIFNENRQPVCERLFFKQPQRILQIAASTDQPLYQLRKKININISTATEGGNYIPANMSMAVYRVDSLTVIDEQNINNYLLLSSDLSGTVESPGYYFTKNNDTVTEATDNLMLTQGWRRFKWQDVFLSKKPGFQFLPEINGHIVTGKVAAIKPGLPVRDVKAYLSVTGTRAQFKIAAADENGRVKFEIKDFYTSGDIIVQTDNEFDSLYRVDIDPPFFTGYSQKKLPPFDFTGRNAALLQMYIDAQVQNTFLFTRLNQSSPPILDTTVFYVKPDASYLLDNYVRFTTLEEVMREYVSQVNVLQRNDKFWVSVYDELTKNYFNYNPLILLDGVPVFNFNKLIKYDPLKIRKLDVVSRKYYLGTNFFGGILSFSTYKGDIAGYEIDPRATIIDYEGLQLQRDFYAPEYATEKQLNSRIPDFRNLLFWSPKVITNAAGKEQTVFYSSDVPGRYAIVIEGISDEGRAGTKVVLFEVKK